MIACGQGAEPGADLCCYLQGVPDFVERELAARYETLQSSLPFFRIWRSVGDAGCYIARREGRVAEVLLFRRESGRLDVLNEMIDIEPLGLQRFADHIFEHIPAIDVIRFHAVRAPATDIGFPMQRHRAKETFVISLPPTPDDYLAALGKSTRANLRSRLNHLKRNFPSFKTRLLVNEEVREDDIRTIIEFSERRMRAKGLALRHDAGRMIALARECGFVTLLLIDGRPCAGSINYRVGASVFGDVTGHDPAFERDGMGALCVYFTICEAIRAGARKFYLGGGLFGFKERMLGRRLDMDQLQIYRSRGAVLANLDRAAVAFAQGQVRGLKRMLHERKGTVLADGVFRLFYACKRRAGK